MFWPELTLPPINLYSLPYYSTNNKHCQGKCELNQDDICIGCGRDINEILGKSGYHEPHYIGG